MTKSDFLAEYRICHSMIKHFDQESWSIGAFLFGGALAATGFVLSQKVSVLRLGALLVLSAILMGGWLAHARRLKAIRDICAERMRYIEANHLTSMKLQSLIIYGINNHEVQIGKTVVRIPRLSAFHAVFLTVGLYLFALLIGVCLLFAHVRFPV
jgi:hypothetical protein